MSLQNTLPGAARLGSDRGVQRFASARQSHDICSERDEFTGIRREVLKVSDLCHAPDSEPHCVKISINASAGSDGNENSDDFD
jgi:hypothetical protein